MLWVLGFVAAFDVICILACCVVSGQHSRMEEEMS
jgi:hypothetical protein